MQDYIDVDEEFGSNYRNLSIDVDIDEEDLYGNKDENICVNLDIDEKELEE